MSDKYILDADRNVVPASLMEWARYFESADRIVRKSVVGEVSVSTVFLGIDHQYGDGPPLLFETMIFGGQHDQWCARCSTWQEAEAQHDQAILVLADTPKH